MQGVYMLLPKYGGKRTLRVAIVGKCGERRLGARELHAGVIGRGSETLWLDGIFEMRVVVAQGDVLDICCVRIEGEMVDRCVRCGRGRGVFVKLSGR